MNGYDFEPREAPSVFLKLKDKGDKVLIRIASEPYREPKIWKLDVKTPMDAEKVVELSEAQWMNLYREVDYNITEVFHWKVIDRESGQAKIFTGSAGVYKQIKKYAQTTGWGDPTTYDIQIERTEQPGPSYYAVTPFPDKNELTSSDKALVSAINMGEKLPAARKLNERQVDYMSAVDGTPEVQTEQVPDNPDVVIDSIDEPINLDDIPF